MTAWDSTEAAGQFVPLPTGSYTAKSIAGELGQSRNGTPRYRVTFEILEGEHTGRRLVRDHFLTPAALPMSKRDLAVLGVERREQFSQPLRPVLVGLGVALRVDDDGTEHNKITRCERLGETRPPCSLPVAPAPSTHSEGAADSTPGAALMDDAFPPYSEGAPNE